MDQKNLSHNAGEALKYAVVLARQQGGNIQVEHLFLGILQQKDCKAMEFLEKSDLDINAALEHFQQQTFVEHTEPIDAAKHSDLMLSAETKRTFDYAMLLKVHMKEAKIGTEILLAAMLHSKFNNVSEYLQTYNITEDSVKEFIKSDSDIPRRSDNRMFKISSPAKNMVGQDEEPYEMAGDGRPKQKTVSARADKSDTPILDSFGKDLTKAASEELLDPIVGREKELERITQILSRRKKNNPILIGEPGVGKSAIAEGLAIRITEKKVARNLLHKRIVTLDIAALVAGTQYRGQFEERMKALLNELGKHPEVILFIDEIHTLVGAGGASGSLDASNMFKPALARGEIQCIGATTLDEYRQYIEKDGALERRFQKILVDPTSTEETIQILDNIKERYEDHHGVHYTPEAINACVFLSNRYISDRLLPDKAIDVLDEAGSRIHIRNIHIPEELLELESQIGGLEKAKQQAVKDKMFREAGEYRDRIAELAQKHSEAEEKWNRERDEERIDVTYEDVAQVIAMMTGVPVQRIAQNEAERLLNVEEKLKEQVIGQDDAIKKVAKAIRRNRAGLKDPNRPIGSFIFLGPTGVGKTHLANTLAKYMFDSSDNLIRVDMSEYMEKFAVSRLIGAPPGYVGYEEGGQLTEKVRRRPYSIILLDEIEKAHPDVFHLLLQVLDDGQLTDGMGRKVDFKNTIIIMTSNVGSRTLKDFGTGVGFSTATRQENKAALEQDVIEKELKKTFAPEFLNRVDDIVFFNTLEREDIHKIIDIELLKLFKRMENMNYQISVTTAVKDFIMDKAWDPNFGARPLKRSIQRYIEDELAERIISHDLSEDIPIIIDIEGEGENRKVTIGEEQEIAQSISQSTEAVSMNE